MQLKNFKYCFKHLPIADATMISATSPMFTVFFARLFIKEPIFKVDLLNFVLVFAGKSSFLSLDISASSTLINYHISYRYHNDMQASLHFWMDRSLYNRSTSQMGSFGIDSQFNFHSIKHFCDHAKAKRQENSNFVLVHNSLGFFKCPKVQMRLMSLINGCQGCFSFLSSITRLSVLTKKILAGHSFLFFEINLK